LIYSCKPSIGTKSQGGKVGKKLLQLSLVCAIFLFVAAADAHITYTGYSGAPGSRGQCAYDCHPQYDFTPTITVTGFPSAYTPGQQYTIAIAHSGGSSIANFNASVRLGTGSTVGGTIAAGTGTSTYNITQETNGVHFTSGSQNSGTFLWTAPASGTGEVRLYWAALQGNITTGADTQIVLISQEGAGGDQAPVIAAISPQTVAENAHLGVRVTASDPDGDPITLIAQQLPANSSFHDSTGGIGGFIFDPNFSQSGSYQVRIIAQSNALADTAFISITVTNVDRSPTLAAISPQTVNEGGHLGVRVTATDPDGDPLTLIAQQLPANSSFHDSTGGVGGFIFDPNFSQSGSFQVRVIAQSNALTDTEFISITVNNVDRKPVLAVVPPQSIAEGSHLGIRTTATDPDNDAIALTAQQLPSNAAFHDSTGGIGGLVFDPDTTQAGQYQIRIIASSNALADTQIVNITVTEQVNGACSYTLGDVNNSGGFNGVDVVFAVGYFKGGPAPAYSCVCGTHGSFFVAGDVNASCNFNGVDVTYMVGYFKGGPAPSACPDCPPAKK
jgi:hypothetical protein